MKKSWMILMLPVLMTLNAFSQNSKKDSITCIPNSQLRTALKLIEKGRFSEEQLQVANSNLAIMETRILNKDSIIVKFDSLENNYKALVSNAESRVKNAEDKSKLDLEWVNKLSNDLRKQKRKTTFAWIIGGVATAAAIFVFAR